MKAKSKTEFSIFGDFKGVKKGNRFELKVRHDYFDRTFEAGHKVTFLGIVKKDFGSFSSKDPKFKFDGDKKSFRFIHQNDINPINE